jgi:hypothetical protein
VTKQLIDIAQIAQTVRELLVVELVGRAVQHHVGRREHRQLRTRG